MNGFNGIESSFVWVIMVLGTLCKDGRYLLLDIIFEIACDR